MSDKYLGEDDVELLYNTATRIPICLCIDTSGSMNTRIEIGGERVKKIDKVIQGLKEFFVSLSNDDFLADAAEVCILGYSTDPYLVRPFKTLSEGADEEVALVPKNKGDMGKAVFEALRLLEERKAQYKKAGRDYYQPCLVIISDGHSTGEAGWDKALRDAQAKTMQMEKDKKLTTISVFIGESWDEDEKARKQLYGFASKNPPRPVGCAELPKYFQFLTKSIASSVASTTGEYIFDFDDWDNF